MRVHEQTCIQSRLDGVDVVITIRNAITHRAQPEWLAGADAVIVGGSGDYSVHHPRSAHWVDPLQKVVDSALTLGVAGFGICFGHQLLGRSLGGTVRTSAAQAERGTVSMQLTANGVSDPVFGHLGGVFRVQTGHSDSVDCAPSGVTILASNAALRTQAFRVDGTDFYSAQFHPELTAEEAAQRYAFYQASLEKAGAPGGDSADHFHPDSNEATGLLRRFALHVARKRR